MYIESQFREADTEELFAHENHAWPPTLSEQGKRRLPTKKSELLTRYLRQQIYQKVTPVMLKLLMVQWSCIPFPSTMLRHLKNMPRGYYTMDKETALQLTKNRNSMRCLKTR